MFESFGWLETGDLNLSTDSGGQLKEECNKDYKRPLRGLKTPTL